MYEKNKKQLVYIIDIKMIDFSMDLIPFDTDLISMELNSTLKECFLEGDLSSLHRVAKAIMKIQTIYGIIPQIKGKGTTSKQIANMILRMRKEKEIVQKEVSVIKELILIDRIVDPITPLLTMLTYEGMIDEFFGTSNSNVELPSELVIDPTQQKESKSPSQYKDKIKFPLNSNDSIFSDIRDLNFSQVGPNLNEKAHEINDYYEQRHKTETVAALKLYLGKFNDFQQSHKNLRIHTNIVNVLLNWTKDPQFSSQLEAEQNLLSEEGNIEISIEFIETCISRQEPLVKVLRLICLLSLTTGGLKENLYLFLIQEITQTYGYDQIINIKNLSKLGFFKKQGESKLGNWFSNLRQQLHLLVLDIDEKNPNDISYVYSGYAPISVRLVEYSRSSNFTKSENIIQNSIREGWGLSNRNYQDALKAVPGPTFSIHQSPVSNIPNEENEENENSDVIIVCFIGGCTFAEISALRWIANKTRIIILTTQILNGNTFIESLYEDLS